MDNSESNDFLFIKSRIVSKTHQTGKFGGAEGRTIEYEPSYADDEEWCKEGVKGQIKTTVSRMASTELKDSERIYVVLGFNSTAAIHKKETTPEKLTIFDKHATDVIKNLSASFVAYLNTEHNRILVSCPLSRLQKVTEMRKGCNSKYYSSVKRIGPLTFQEQVSQYLLADTEWEEKDKDVLIEIVPNLTRELRKDYSAKVIEFLVKSGKQPVDIQNGMILADLNKETTTKLLEASNLVFQVEGVPEGVAQKIRAGKPIQSEYIENKETFLTKDTLPSICLLDSGVSKISQLQGLVQHDGFHTFLGDYEDGGKDEGHGTPIACLAIFGEGERIPKTKIISYKIHSDEKPKKLSIMAYEYAINKYSPITRIFLSSINFKLPSPKLTAYLDHFIQAKNVCFIVSAGNIRKPQEIYDYAAAGISCADYVHNYPVEDPASAINIMAVGAISKKPAPNSISKEDELAPFTRCGVTQGLLHSCRKPEVVQNGGNICKDETSIGLESFDKYGQKNTECFVGTSFASPLLARNIAEIEGKYGKKIQNVETLKAIALASARVGNHVCMGFGETRSFLDCDDSHALAYAEGNIPLIDRVSVDKHYIESKAYVKLKVPTGVSSIEMFIVHSDNNYWTTEPCLNTYLKVYAFKEGNETNSVTLFDKSVLEKKAHIKLFKWKFVRSSMEGIWTFVIVPEVTVNMLPEHQKDTVVRFGCAIKLASRELPRARGPYSLAERFRKSNGRYTVR